jgi:hypothetical protein
MRVELDEPEYATSGRAAIRPATAIRLLES